VLYQQSRTTLVIAVAVSQAVALVILLGHYVARTPARRPDEDKKY
jgi:hypothetical protein